MIDLNAELQAVLAEVKRLSGIVPFCAWCKKIRDAEGVWHQLETYLSELQKLISAMASARIV